MDARAGSLAALVAIGAVWGITIPLMKITVSAGYEPMGLIFWQVTISVFVLGAVLALRRDPALFRFSPKQLAFCLMIALIGTVLPNCFSYAVAAQLPGAVLSIILSTIPMLAFPVALLMGNDTFSIVKFAGLSLGLAGMVVLGWDGAALPDGTAWFWLALAFVAPAFYAFEGNIVNKIGSFDLDPVQILFGASAIGVVVSLPLALLSGQFISPFRTYGAPEWAHALSSVAHGLVYAGYLWLVGRAGSVFAAQVSYLVTLFGIFWAIVLLSETIAPELWIALALTLAGLALVQPRSQSTLPKTDAPQ